MTDQDNDFNDDSADETHAYRLAHLAAVMMGSRIREKPAIFADDNLSSPFWDSEFEGALKRADMLLKAAKNRDVDVSAYQVFQEGDIMSLEQIAETFHTINWPKLTAKGSVTKLLNTLEKAMTDFVTGAEDHRVGKYDEVSERAYKEVFSALKAISLQDDVKATFRRFDDEVEDFISRLKQNPKSLNFPPALCDGFLDWCFPHYEQAGRTIRKFRPHEIFRFCESFNNLPDVPTVTLSDLSQRFQPFPPQSMWPISFPLFERSSRNSYRKRFESDIPEQSENDPIR